MQLYAGSTKQFVADEVQNQIGRKLEASFFDHYRFKPSPNEVRSWRLLHRYRHAELLPKPNLQPSTAHKIADY
jgi:hypothetical protein